MRYLITFLVGLIAGTLILTAAAQAEPDICQYAARNTGAVAEWDSLAEQWRGMPEQLDPIDLFFVTDPTLPDYESQAYQVAVDWQGKRVWVFPFYSLENDGDGNHMLCDVLVYRGR